VSNLPEQYQRYAHPTAVTPAEVKLYTERPPIAWVVDPRDPSLSVAIDARLIQRPEPAPPRDLTPQPLFDPLAQRLAGAGIGAGAAGAGIGWGVGQAAAGIATIGGATAVVVMLALWLLARAGRPSVHVRQEVHNHARWFGRNTTNL
jgi:hypothetical protein